MNSTIIWTDFDCYISKYFNVGEVTNREKARIPTNPTHRNNILALARELDKVREDWGSPIRVTSWYRPLIINRAIGSSDRSQHVTGKAVDIYPVARNLLDFEKWLDERWYGALGYGQKARRGFTHLDIRNGKGWETGGTKGARWNY